MGSFERKLNRNKLKSALKANKQKRTQPLSKYRFLTDEEKQNAIAERLTEQMMQTAKKSIGNQANND